MKYLVIDRTMTMPIRNVVDTEGLVFGNTQLLHDNEVQEYAKWLGLVGGRELLDAFEVKLINEGMLRVWPVNADGDPLYAECEALGIRRYDTGTRLQWEPRVQCPFCHGHGHHNLGGELVDEEDLCLSCCGCGYITGAVFETDLDGRPLGDS